MPPAALPHRSPGTCHKGAGLAEANQVMTGKPAIITLTSPDDFSAPARPTALPSVPPGPLMTHIERSRSGPVAVALGGVEEELDLVERGLGVPRLGGGEPVCVDRTVGERG